MGVALHPLAPGSPGGREWGVGGGFRVLAWLSPPRGGRSRRARCPRSLTAGGVPGRGCRWTLARCKVRLSTCRAASPAWVLSAPPRQAGEAAGPPSCPPSRASQALEAALPPGGRAGEGLRGASVCPLGLCWAPGWPVPAGGRGPGHPASLPRGWGRLPTVPSARGSRCTRLGLGVPWLPWAPGAALRPPPSAPGLLLEVCPCTL